MADVSTFEAIDLPVDAAWNGMGDFSETRQWALKKAFGLSL